MSRYTPTSVKPIASCRPTLAALGSVIQVVNTAMGKVEAGRLAASKIDDASLWKMSQNPQFVDAGKSIFATNCAACHLPSMRGKTESPTAIGPDLTDTRWIHGGKPSEIHDLISKGVLLKGMPSWGPVLGARKISEVAAYLLSVHHEGEAVTLEPSSTPGT